MVLLVMVSVMVKTHVGQLVRGRVVLVFTVVVVVEHSSFGISPLAIDCSDGERMTLVSSKTVSVQSRGLRFSSASTMETTKAATIKKSLFIINLR